MWLSYYSRSEDKKDVKKEGKEVKPAVTEKVEKEDNKEIVAEESTQNKDADNVTTENMDLDEKW